MIKIYKYGEVENNEIFSRMADTVDVSDIVTGIIENVKANGDKALFEYCEKFDKATLTSLEVTEEEIEEAFNTVEPEFLRILRTAEENIRKFHEKQVRNSFIINEKNGVVTGQKITAIEKVGLYVPGGTAAYPSTVLMDSVPAKIAGCKEICIVTPPSKDGKVNPVILAAAKIAGVDRIFKVGGAQAVAALAYGTETVPKVDKIVGPGNAFVAEAKRQVFGMVSIDMIAGPSEILVLADGKSNPDFVAADLLSQAEHDKNASAVLVTDSMELAEKVSKLPAAKIAILNKSDIANRYGEQDFPFKNVFDEIIIASAKDESGLISALSGSVNRLMTDEKISARDTAIVSSARQHAELLRAHDFIECAIAGLNDGFAQDAVSSDIERALGAVSGSDAREVSESVVSDIFSKFCVGK